MHIKTPLTVFKWELIAWIHTQLPLETGSNKNSKILVTACFFQFLMAGGKPWLSGVPPKSLTWSSSGTSGAFCVCSSAHSHPLPLPESRAFTLDEGSSHCSVTSCSFQLICRHPNSQRSLTQMSWELGFQKKNFFFVGGHSLTHNRKMKHSIENKSIPSIPKHLLRLPHPFISKSWGRALTFLYFETHIPSMLTYSSMLHLQPSFLPSLPLDGAQQRSQSSQAPPC